LEITAEGGPAVRAEGAEGDTSVLALPSVSNGPLPGSRAAVIPGDSDIASGLIDGDAREELTPTGEVVIQQLSSAPGIAAVIGEAQVNVQIAGRGVGRVAVS